MRKIQVLCFGIFAVLGSPIANAHGLHGAGFMAGLAHPLLGFDHLLALLGMGAGVATFGARKRWAAAGLMLSGLLAGLSAGLFSGLHAGSSVDPWLAATLLVLAVMLLRQKVFAAPLRLPLIVLFACLHGFAHGVDWPPQQAMAPFAAGVACTSLALFALGMAFGRLRHPRAQTGLGGLLGIAGLGFLFGA